MTAQPGISEPLIRFQASGWIISLCLHGTAIFLAGLLAARIGLAPPSSSFHWDVTVIGAQPPATPAQAAPDPQTLAAAVIRPTQRRAPATAVRPTPSHTAPQTTPTTTTASLPVDAPYEAATVLTPPTQEPQQLLEPTRTGPLPEPEVTRPEPEVARMEPQPALHATSAPVEAPCRHRLQLPLRRQLLLPQSHPCRRALYHHPPPNRSQPRLKRHPSPHRATRPRLRGNRTTAGSQGLYSSESKRSSNIP